MCLFLVCTSSDTFRYFLLLVRRGSELFGVSAQTDSGIRIFGIPYIPCTRSYCAYFWCASFLRLSGIFYTSIMRWSELLGVSTQNDSGIRILAFLICRTRN